MKRKRTSPWALLLCALTLLTCNKHDDNPPTPNPPLPDVSYTDIKVALPEGTALGLSEVKVMAGMQTAEVSGDGSASIAHVSGGRTLAVVVNAEGDPLMAGFIRNGNTEISMASTLEACYYFGLGTVFLQDSVKDAYFEQSASLTAFGESRAELESQFVANPNFIHTEAFEEWMAGKLDLVRSDERRIDLYASVAGSVEADANDIRSGLQVFEEAGTSIKIANTYRRRAKAFVYKTAIKEENKAEDVLIPDVAKHDSPTEKTATINSVQAKREFLGIVGDWASGTGIEFFRTETDPIPLELGDNEEYAKYKVRVVGVTMKTPDLDRFNKQELEAYEELVYESLTVDLILPFVLDLYGEAELLDGLDEKFFKELSALIRAGASSVPGMTDAIAKGDMEGAFKAFVSGFYGNAMGEFRGNFLEGVRDGVLAYAAAKSGATNAGGWGNTKDEIIDKFDGANKIMDWTDRLLKMADYGAIFYGWGNSRELEEWEVKAKQEPVILTPKDAVAFPYIRKYFKAVAKNIQLADGEHFKYVWKTSGRYGDLNDNRGHRGTDFENSSEEVFYLARLSDSNVPEDATETVICSIYVEKGQSSKLVGTDSVELRVKAYKYELKPEGATVQGNTTLELQLLRADFTEDITSNPQLDYRVVWSTAGEYGEFERGGKTMTTYNSNTVGYKALDREVERGTEVITARVYGKLKSESDAGYELYDEIEGKIYVENDSLKLTYYVPIDVKSELQTTPRCWYGVWNVWRWNPSEAQADIPAGFEVERYVMNVEGSNVSYCNSQSKTWNPANQAEDLVGGNYELLCWRNSGGHLGSGGDCSGTQASMESSIQRAKRNKGYAKVTVRLKQKE